MAAAACHAPLQRQSKPENFYDSTGCSSSSNIGNGNAAVTGNCSSRGRQAAAASLAALWHHSRHAKLSMLHINTALSMLPSLCEFRVSGGATLAPAARLLVCFTGSLQLQIANNVAEPFWPCGRHGRTKWQVASGKRHVACGMGNEAGNRPCVVTCQVKRLCLASREQRAGRSLNCTLRRNFHQTFRSLPLLLLLETQ